MLAGSRQPPLLDSRPFHFGVLLVGPVAYPTRESGYPKADAAMRTERQVMNKMADSGELRAVRDPLVTGQRDIGRHGRSSKQGIYGDYSGSNLELTQRLRLRSCPWVSSVRIAALNHFQR